MRQHSIVPANETVYEDEHLSLEFVNKSVTLNRRKMHFTRTEYDLLAFLVRHAGEAIPREALLMEVWGYGPAIRTRTLDVHVRRLRKKLGHYADRGIETVSGIGYRFQPGHEAPLRTSAADAPLPISA
jgi:DNA-binding response OmpR family regulator